jgi:hypothetical protein
MLPPLTASPMTSGWLPQAWSVPPPVFGRKLREKSDSVNEVTLAAGADIGHRAVKGREPRVQLAEQGLLLVELVRVRVERAERREKHLSTRAERAAGLDDLGDRQQLLPRNYS